MDHITEQIGRPKKSQKGNGPPISGEIVLLRTLHVLPMVKSLLPFSCLSSLLVRVRGLERRYGASRDRIVVVVVVVLGFLLRSTSCNKKALASATPL